MRRKPFLAPMQDSLYDKLKAQLGPLYEINSLEIPEQPGLERFEFMHLGSKRVLSLDVAQSGTFNKLGPVYMVGNQGVDDSAAIIAPQLVATLASHEEALKKKDISYHTRSSAEVLGDYIEQALTNQRSENPNTAWGSLMSNEKTRITRTPWNAYQATENRTIEEINLITRKQGGGNLKPYESQALIQNTLDMIGTSPMPINSATREMRYAGGPKWRDLLFSGFTLGAHGKLAPTTEYYDIEEDKTWLSSMKAVTTPSLPYGGTIATPFHRKRKDGITVLQEVAASQPRGKYMPEYGEMTFTVPGEQAARNVPFMHVLINPFYASGAGAKFVSQRKHSEIDTWGYPQALTQVLYGVEDIRTLAGEKSPLEVKSMVGRNLTAGGVFSFGKLRGEDIRMDTSSANVNINEMYLQIPMFIDPNTGKASTNLERGVSSAPWAAQIQERLGIRVLPTGTTETRLVAKGEAYDVGVKWRGFEGKVGFVNTGEKFSIQQGGLNLPVDLMSGEFKGATAITEGFFGARSHEQTYGILRDYAKTFESGSAERMAMKKVTSWFKREKMTVGGDRPTTSWEEITAKYNEAIPNTPIWNQPAPALALDIFQKVFTDIDVTQIGSKDWKRNLRNLREYDAGYTPNVIAPLGKTHPEQVTYMQEIVVRALRNNSRIYNTDPTSIDYGKLISEKEPTPAEIQEAFSVYKLNGGQNIDIQGVAKALRGRKGLTAEDMIDVTQIASGRAFYTRMAAPMQAEFAARSRANPELMLAVSKKFPEFATEMGINVAQMARNPSPIAQSLTAAAAFVSWNLEFREGRVSTSHRPLNAISIDRAKALELGGIIAAHGDLSTTSSDVDDVLLQKLMGAIRDKEGNAIQEGDNRLLMLEGTQTPMLNPASIRALQYKDLGKSMGAISRMYIHSFQGLLGMQMDAPNLTAEENLARGIEPVESFAGMLSDTFQSRGEAYHKVHGRPMPTGWGGRYTYMAALGPDEMWIPPEQRRKMLMQAGYKRGSKELRKMELQMATGGPVSGIGVRYPMGTEFESIMGMSLISDVELMNRTSKSFMVNLLKDPAYKGVAFTSMHFATIGVGDFDYDPMTSAWLLKGDEKSQKAYEELTKRTTLTTERTMEIEKSIFENPTLRDMVNSFVGTMSETVIDKNIDIVAKVAQKGGWFSSGDIREEGMNVYLSKIGMGVAHRVRAALIPAMAAHGYSEEEQTRMYAAMQAWYQPHLDKKKLGALSAGTGFVSAIAKSRFDINKDTRVPELIIGSNIPTGQGFTKRNVLPINASPGMIQETLQYLAELATQPILVDKKQVQLASAEALAQMFSVPTKRQELQDKLAAVGPEKYREVLSQHILSLLPTDLPSFTTPEGMEAARSYVEEMWGLPALGAAASRALAKSWGYEADINTENEEDVMYRAKAKLAGAAFDELYGWTSALNASATENLLQRGVSVPASNVSEAIYSLGPSGLRDRLVTLAKQFSIPYELPEKPPKPYDRVKTSEATDIIAQQGAMNNKTARQMFAEDSLTQSVKDDLLRVAHARGTTAEKVLNQRIKQFGGPSPMMAASAERSALERGIPNELPWRPNKFEQAAMELHGVGGPNSGLLDSGGDVGDENPTTEDTIRNNAEPYHGKKIPKRGDTGKTIEDVNEYLDRTQGPIATGREIKRGLNTAFAEGGGIGAQAAMVNDAIRDINSGRMEQQRSNWSYSGVSNALDNFARAFKRISTPEASGQLSGAIQSIQTKLTEMGIISPGAKDWDPSITNLGGTIAGVMGGPRALELASTVVPFLPILKQAANLRKLARTARAAKLSGLVAVSDETSAAIQQVSEDNPPAGINQLAWQAKVADAAQYELISGGKTNPLNIERLQELITTDTGFRDFSEKLQSANAFSRDLSISQRAAATAKVIAENPQYASVMEETRMLRKKVPPNYLTGTPEAERVQEMAMVGDYMAQTKAGKQALTGITGNQLIPTPEAVKALGEFYKAVEEGNKIVKSATTSEKEYNEIRTKSDERIAKATAALGEPMRESRIQTGYTRMAGIAKRALETGEMTIAESKEIEETKEQIAGDKRTQAEARQSGFTRFARRALGGFGLMYLRNIYGIATEGIGWGAAQADEMNTQIQGVIGERLGRTSVFATPAQRAQIAMGLAGGGATAQTLQQAWAAANPNARSLGQAAISGVAVAGATSWLAEMIPELGALGKISVLGPLAVVAGVASYTASAAALGKDPQALGWRLYQAGANLSQRGSPYLGLSKDFTAGYGLFLSSPEDKATATRNLAINQAVGGYFIGERYVPPMPLVAAIKKYGAAEAATSLSNIYQSRGWIQNAQAAAQVGAFYTQYAGAGISAFDEKTVSQMGAYAAYGVDLQGIYQKTLAAYGAGTQKQFGRDVTGIVTPESFAGSAAAMYEASAQAGVQMGPSGAAVQELGISRIAALPGQGFIPIPTGVSQLVSGQRTGGLRGRDRRVYETQDAADARALREENQKWASLEAPQFAMAQYQYQAWQAQAQLGGTAPAPKVETFMGKQYSQADVAQAQYAGAAAAGFTQRLYGGDRNVWGAMIGAGMVNVSGKKLQTTWGAELPAEFAAYTNYTPSIGGAGGQVTGQPYGTTSLQMGKISGAAMAQNIWGQKGAGVPTNFAEYGRYGQQLIQAMTYGYNFDTNKIMRTQAEADAALQAGQRIQAGAVGGQGGQNQIAYDQAMAGIGIGYAQIAQNMAFTTGVGLNKYAGTINPQTNQPFGFNTGKVSWNAGALGSFTSTGGGTWGLEDANRALGIAQTEESFNHQQKALNIGAAQFAENMNMNKKQAVMQRQWSREDWQFQATTRELSWQWKQEDYAEESRFMTGRQRRLAERGMKRETTMHNLEEEQITKTQDRQKQLWKLEDQRFQIQEKQFKQNQQLAQEDLNNSKTFWKIKLDLEEQGIKLARAAWVEQMNLQKASLGVQAAAAKQQLEINNAMSVYNTETGTWEGYLNNLVEDTFPKLIKAVGTDIPTAFEEMVRRMKLAVGMSVGKSKVTPKVSTSGLVTGGEGGSQTGEARGGWILPGTTTIVGDSITGMPTGYEETVTALPGGGAIVGNGAGAKVSINSSVAVNRSGKDKTQVPIVKVYIGNQEFKGYIVRTVEQEIVA